MFVQFPCKIKMGCLLTEMFCDTIKIVFENKIVVDLNKNNEEIIAEFKKTISDSPSIEFRDSPGRVKTEASLSPGQFITGNISGSSSVGYRVTRGSQQGVIMAGHATFKNDIFRVNGVDVVLQRV